VNVGLWVVWDCGGGCVDCAVSVAVVSSVNNRGQVGRLIFIGIVSLPDYDIGAGCLVLTIRRRPGVRLASATSTAAFGQLGRNRVPRLIGAAGLLSDDVRPGPFVWIDGHEFGHEPVAILGRPCPAAHTLHKFSVPMS
jgi:hypothetical protein